jgi:hypothetical protein
MLAVCAVLLAAVGVALTARLSFAGMPSALFDHDALIGAFGVTALLGEWLIVGCITKLSSK